jgi:hypothetical protein
MVVEAGSQVVQTWNGGRSYQDCFPEGALVVRTKTAHEIAYLEQRTPAMEAMDWVLWEHFQKAVKRGIQTPLKGTTVYKLMRNARQHGISVDVKDSTYRNLRAFLESLEKDGYLSLKPNVSDPVILAINSDLVLGLKPTRNKPASTGWTSTKFISQERKRSEPAPSELSTITGPSTPEPSERGGAPSKESQDAGTTTPVSGEEEPADQLDEEETPSIASQDLRMSSHAAAVADDDAEEASATAAAAKEEVIADDSFWFFSSSWWSASPASDSNGNTNADMEEKPITAQEAKAEPTAENPVAENCTVQ